VSVKAKRHVVHHRKKRHVVHHRKKRRHVTHHLRRRRRKAGAAAPAALAYGGGWLDAGNDQWPVCAAAAVANGLLYAGGPALPVSAVLALHDAARGDAWGADLDDVLAELAARGICGIRPASVGLHDRPPLPQSGNGECILADAEWAGGSHAVVLHPAGWITWGRLLAPFGTIERTWRIRW
jgi:hypothetical protein